MIQIDNLIGNLQLQETSLGAARSAARTTCARSACAARVEDAKHVNINRGHERYCVCANHGH